jgi:hypothetical protein
MEKIDKGREVKLSLGEWLERRFNEILGVVTHLQYHGDMKFDCQMHCCKPQEKEYGLCTRYWHDSRCWPDRRGECPWDHWRPAEDKEHVAYWLERRRLIEDAGSRFAKKNPCPVEFGERGELYEKLKDRDRRLEKLEIRSPLLQTAKFGSKR